MLLPFLAFVACSGSDGPGAPTKPMPSGGASQSGGSSGKGGAGGAESSGGSSGGGQSGSAGMPAASGGKSTGDAGRGSGASGGDGATGGVGGSTGGVGSAGAGTGGSAQDGGASGMGGASGAGGAGGVGGAGNAGAAGNAGMAGTGGTGTPDICSFELEDELSPAMATVGIVNWSTDLEGLTEARIEFTLDDPAADEINRGSGGAIDIAGETHRALLLGLKASRSYTYRIIAKSGGTACISPDRTITTGALATTPPITHTLTRAPGDTAALSPGYIVTCHYSSPSVFILDTDGDLVWRAEAPDDCSRARMDWEGEQMWLLDANPTWGSVGEVRRISMDGTDVLLNVPGLEDAHHDLAVRPGGIVATVVWTASTGASDLVERAPDGTLSTIATSAEMFGSRSTYHANSLAYYEADDTYTVGDLEMTGFTKVTRAGEPLWDFRAACSDTDPLCAEGDLIGNHGHHLVDGRFLFFKARETPSRVFEYTFTETPSSISATLLWTYDPGDAGSFILGDVQRLPNGNTLITYSGDREFRELSPEGDLLQSIVSNVHLGYADYRETLYGPPLR